MTDTRHDEPLEALLRELARVQQHHAERASNPELASALLHLGRWQSLRLRNTYADLEQTPRYATAMKFFEEDLYGGADFAQRDADLVKVVPAMKRLMPANVIDTVAVAVELNALSQDLDRAVVDALGSRAQTFSVADYCTAYRRAGGFEGVMGEPELFEFWSLIRDRGSFGKCIRANKGFEDGEFLEHAYRNFAEAAPRWLTGSEAFTAKLNPAYAPYGDYDQLMRLEEWYGRK